MHRLPGLSRPSLLLSLGLTLSLLQGCAPVEEEPSPSQPAVVAQGLGVPGFAELHHHMFAEQAFGGGWFHGSAIGTLNRCDGGLPESSHARVRMDLSNLL